MQLKKLKHRQVPKKQKIRFNFEAIGTSWVIDIFESSKPKNRIILKKIREEINEFDLIFSRFRTDSLVSKMAGQTGNYRIPKKYLPILELYLNLYRKTRGALTPLIGNVLEDAGYDASYSLKPKTIRPILNWEESLEFNLPNIKIKKPVTLDFGAGGKGFLVDIIGKLLEDSEFFSYCIDAGGDILFKTEDEKPIKVGLENPNNTSQVIGAVEIINQSICGSAGNRRKWLEFHHIFNPQTLKPVDDILSVWVIAKSALLADTLSTCLFLTDPALLKEFHFEYLILFPDYSIKTSDNFSAQIYYN